jgi:hypothetical protein
MKLDKIKYQLDNKIRQIKNECLKCTSVPPYTMLTSRACESCPNFQLITRAEWLNKAIEQNTEKIQKSKW